MKNSVFKKLLVVPCVASIVALYFIGLNLYNKIDRTDDTLKESSVSTAVPDTDNGIDKINLNTATKEELTLIDGIGEKYAEAIIEMREKLGGYSSAEQLLNVDGIGEKLFNKIKDFVKVE